MSLYISGNLSYKTSTEAIANHFAACGKCLKFFLSRLTYRESHVSVGRFRSTSYDTTTHEENAIWTRRAATTGQVKRMRFPRVFEGLWASKCFASTSFCVGGTEDQRGTLCWRWREERREDEEAEGQEREAGCTFNTPFNTLAYSSLTLCDGLCSNTERKQPQSLQTGEKPRATT